MSLFSLALVTAALGAVAFFYSRLLLLQSETPMVPRTSAAERYRPMLRLLSPDDLQFVPPGAARRRLQQRRIRLFRSYLRSLARDYGQLLSGVRMMMVHSSVDRPDLAKLLLRNQTLFALALCRIEMRLLLRGFGIGTVDVSPVLQALETLRSAHSGLLAAQPATA